jgi:hypothetical protein
VARRRDGDGVVTDGGDKPMSDTPKQYAERDTEALAEHYFRHVLAMTAEGLHEKSAIAAELAWRDAEIERLTRELCQRTELVVALKR